MATIILTAVGTAIGGPIGGAIGSLIGNQIDRAVFSGGKRQGARLKELAVTTSSYGTPIPRHFGTMRTAGSVIWATDLVETSESGGGGKGKPSTTSFTYSVSFAVALASRPIRALGRVWADGNLLRGEAGDLKTGGVLRVHNGHGDQAPDPLIAADQGATCPAFRGLAYCVFESLQLADFGNRIPALTFEIVADDGSVSLAELLRPVPAVASADRDLPALAGFSDSGGPLSGTLATMSDVYPIGCDCSGAGLSLFAADALPPTTTPLLPEPAADATGEGFGSAAGQVRRRAAEQGAVPEAMRYYDTGRDFQAGLQRADGRARAGRGEVLEFPGALASQDARNLANAAAERAGWGRDAMSWRLAELDPDLRPGTVVRLPGKSGHWRVHSWEWREGGVELELLRVPHAPPRQTAADTGQSLPTPDLLATPTMLAAFGLPWDGAGSAEAAPVFAAASAASPGWTGAALFAVHPDGGLERLAATGARRATIGTTMTALPPSPAILLEQTTLDVQLAAPDLLLGSTTAQSLANGANRALVAGELLQFGAAESLGGGRWRLSGLLRGRGGTEGAAATGAPSGAPFVLLDGKATMLDPARLPSPATVAALGLADADPVIAPVINPSLGITPLSPVHGAFLALPGGGVTAQWCRRARGAWAWADQVDVPLVEQAELYRVGVGDPGAPALAWEVTTPQLGLTAPEWAAVVTAHSGAPLWVCQVGTHTASPPLSLGIVA